MRAKLRGESCRDREEEKMNLRAILRYAGALALILVILRLGGDTAFGSETLKGKKPAKNANGTTTIQEPCDTTLDLLHGGSAGAA